MAYGDSSSPGRPGDAVPPAEPLPVQRTDAGQLGGSRRHFTVIAVAALVMAALLVWSAVPHPAPASPTSHAATPSGVTTNWSVSISTVVTTPITPMPIFHDWHVAYVGPDEALHAVSIYGGQAVGGLPVPGLAAAAADLNEYPRLAALSPDGHYLAYSLSAASPSLASSSSILLLDVRAAALPQPYAGTESLHTENLFWSPDSSKLAFESNRNGTFAIYYISPKELPPQAVPGISDDSNGIWRLLGWIDATHLAVLANQQGTAVLGALDVGTGEFRSIARLLACCLDNVYLAPDGARAVVDSAGSGTAIQVVDMATGTTHMLPNLTRQVSLTWSAIAWKPGDHVLTVTTFGPSASSGSLGPVIQILDLDHDTFTSLPLDEYALGWSPDGQALIVGNPTNLTSKPTGDLRAVTFPQPGVTAHTVLTQSAAAFLGFMRTA